MRISEEKIEEIRNSVDIVDIISGYLSLKKRGKNFIGQCPFHTEKTPSFTVSPDKQIYHCFGCHAGGNVYNFLMQYNNISFTEAVIEAATNAGITVEENKDKGQQTDELEELYEINKAAAFYFSMILNKSESGKSGREYLKKRRIKEAVQKEFGVGFAPQGWDGLLNYCIEKKLDLEKCRQLGLIDKKENNSYYDKYRDRIIFPIYSANGRIIGFGGRILEKNENVAKYINSPESSIYSKRKSLYALFNSKDEIRKKDKVFLVEGYMDCISLHQAGIKNVVASSGTALTEEQVGILSRYTKNIIVLFDADEAGLKAADKSIELLLKQDFDVKILELPSGEDPDSYIVKYGREKFEEAAARSVSFLEYSLGRYEKKGLLKEPASQAEAIREIVKNAALIKDELKRNLIIKSISSKFNLREKLIESELGKFLNKTEETATKQVQKTVRGNQTGEAGKKGGLWEKDIVSLLFSGDEIVLGMIFDNIPVESLENEKYREIAEIVLAEYKRDKISASHLIEKITDEQLKNIVMKLAVEKETLSKRWESREEGDSEKDNLNKYAFDVVKKHKISKIDNIIKKNNSKIENLTNETDIIELIAFNNELNADKKRISAEKYSK